MTILSYDDVLVHIVRVKTLTISSENDPDDPAQSFDSGIHIYSSYDNTTKQHVVHLVVAYAEEPDSEIEFVLDDCVISLKYFVYMIAELAIEDQFITVMNDIAIMFGPDAVLPIDITAITISWNVAVNEVMTIYHRPAQTVANIDIDIGRMIISMLAILIAGYQAGDTSCTRAFVDILKYNYAIIQQRTRRTGHLSQPLDKIRIIPCADSSIEPSER